jgi:hypothetical protein
MGLFGWNTFSTADTPTLDDMLKSMRELKAEHQRYRDNQAVDFALMRAEGLEVWRWDKPCGENWVVADSLYEQLKQRLPVMPPSHSPVFEMATFYTGITLWRLSDAERAGFEKH